MKTRRALVFYTFIGAILQVFPVIYSHVTVNRCLYMFDASGRTIPLLLILMNKFVLFCYIIPFLFLALVINGIIRKKVNNVFIHILGAEVLTPLIIFFFGAGSLLAFIMSMGLRKGM